MDEKEQVIQAKESLKISIKNVERDLKIYGKAVIKRNNAFVKNIGNSIISSFENIKKELKNKKELQRIEREQQREKEQEELESQNKYANYTTEQLMSLLGHYKNEINKLAPEEVDKKIKIEQNIAKIEALVVKNDKKQGLLKFKTGIKQKASSIKSKFGKISNSILAKVNFTNADVKVRNEFEKAQINGLEKINSDLETMNNAKNKVVGLTNEQIEKYKKWREEKKLQRIEREQQKEKEREELERQKEIELPDRLQEEELQRRTAERKKAMIEALVKNDIEQGLLKFKTGVKQKASSVKSKFGKISNSILAKANFANADVKIRNEFEKAQINGLEKINSGLETMNNAKNKVVGLTNEQIEKYKKWREEKKLQRIEREQQKEKEREELERQREIELPDRLQEEELQRRTAERKKAMTEALNEKERDEYNEEYEKYHSNKQELIKEFMELRNELFKIKGMDESQKRKSR